MAPDEFEIHVTQVSQSEITNLIHGFILFHGERIAFSAVAYGRYGGQNVQPQFSAKARRRLRKLGVDLSEFELEVQQKMLQGDLVMEEKEGQARPDA